MNRKLICTTEDLSPEEPFLFELNGDEQGVIFQTDTGYYAVENRCPHAGAYLHEGEVEDDILMCVWHGWRFDLETGQSLTEYWAKLKTYTLEVEGSDIYILL